MAEKTQRKEYRRFSAAQRFEHIVLLVTFTGLALTGLPQKYAAEAWAQWMISVMGGIESVRIVHRVLATLLMMEAIYHGGVISYKLFVLGRRAVMMPTWRDARDVRDWVFYNLGLKAEHPRLPRYNFGEKAEYLAVVWGTVVMIITGFMMWNPIAAARFLPGAWIPAARAAHGAEAVLAVLAILTWHTYNVHLKHFNRSMFTGRLTREEMLEEHAEELEAIERGEKPRELPPEIIERRKRRFWPYATVMTILLLSGLFWFTTFEESAITTVPRQRLAVDAPIAVSADAGDPAQGEALWTELPCQGCHGEQAQGSDLLLGVPLAGTSLDFETFVRTVRRGPADMPAFGPSQVSDQTLAHLWAWLRTLPAP